MLYNELVDGVLDNTTLGVGPRQMTEIFIIGSENDYFYTLKPVFGGKKQASRLLYL
jgi:hypothetical protein